MRVYRIYRLYLTVIARLVYPDIVLSTRGILITTGIILLLAIISWLPMFVPVAELFEQ